LLRRYTISCMEKTNITVKIKILFLLTSFISSKNLNARSIHRPADPDDPCIYVTSSLTGDCYKMIDSQLQNYPIFNCYNEDHFNKNLLPATINFRYEPEKFVSAKEINDKIDNLISELKNKKRIFSDFKVLKCTDFNSRKKAGFIVVKFKDYPFVLKLFKETPKSITDFSTRGVQERAIFAMSSSMRHFAGLTRIRNIEKIKKTISPNHKWYNELSLPRKWFWLPENPDFLLIKAHNLGGKKESVTKIPAFYAIICDEIKFSKKKVSINDCIEFCSELNFILDPHYKNFTYDEINGKLTIIDTEFFPILMGLRHKLKPYKNYLDWYTMLGCQFIKHKFGMLKSMRRVRQHQDSFYYDLYN
jgi:hypothetical protein